MESYATIRSENAAELGRLNLRGHAVAKLQKIARSLHHLDEHSCNYGLTDRQEKNEARLESQAAEIAKEARLKVYRQGDPRGWPLYVWRQRDLTKYAKRYEGSPHQNVSGIDCCYSEVGTGVCPH